MVKAFEFANRTADSRKDAGPRYDVKSEWGDGAHSDAHYRRAAAGRAPLDLPRLELVEGPAEAGHYVLRGVQAMCAPVVST